MIIEIGHFSVVIALVLSAFGIASSILALKTRSVDWVRVGRMSLTLIFILLSIGMASLIYSFLIRDFSVHYVATTSNSQLPLFYTIAAVWEAMKAHFCYGSLSYRHLAPSRSGSTGEPNQLSCRISLAWNA